MEVVTNAVAKLDIDWPAEKQEAHHKRKLDEEFLSSDSQPPCQTLFFLFFLLKPLRDKRLGQDVPAGHYPFFFGLFSEAVNTVVGRFQEDKKQAVAFQRYIPWRVEDFGAVTKEQPQLSTSSSRREQQKQSVVC